MKILVTGGTGFLGKRLVKKLLDEGHKVSVFVRHEQDDFPEGAILYTGDIRDKAALKKAFSGVNVVYHLAICLNEAEPDMWDINVNGTQNVADMCKETGVKALIYMGSSGVLGETKEPSREDLPYNPKTKYERSKMEGEKIVKNSGVSYTIIRTTIIIGPNIVWMKILDAARKGYPIIGNGKNHFHLVYVEDVVNMLALVKNEKNAANQIFHIASKDVPTYEEVYRIMCDELKCEMSKKHIPVALAYLMSYLHTTKRKMQGKPPSLTMMRSSIDRLIRNRIISTEKAKKLLGFEAKYSTREAVRETIKYLRIAHLGYSDYDLSEIGNVKPINNKKNGCISMKTGNVEKYINEKIEKDGGIISIIIDPVDYPHMQKAIDTAIMAHEAGFDIVAVGGSIGAQGKLLDSVTKAIKEKVKTPVVLFPGNIATITPYADAIYFMSLLNSRNPYWISQAQTLAAPLIKNLNVEPLPIGYIVVEPGGTVGWVGDANVVPRNKPQIAAALALAGQYNGNRIIFTDAGSAAYEPVPVEIVSAVSHAIDVPYLVAGGIKTPKQAGDIIAAGADWIQIGTAAEKSKDPKKMLKSFVDAVKQAGRKKIRNK